MAISIKILNLRVIRPFVGHIKSGLKQATKIYLDSGLASNFIKVNSSKFPLDVALNKQSNNQLSSSKYL
jgi:hypothetical protein